MIWKFDACGFDFQSVQLSGIQPELYSVYQAAKAISTGSRNITLANLASPELVTDEAFHLNLNSMKELINLTFCCQQATVITDFTNLKEVGRDHYMNIHGGCASMEELEQLDGEETAILLIEDNEGTMGGLS